MPWKLAHRGLRRRHRQNVQTLRRSPLAEISGALGDLGTLLPLMTALAVQGSVSLSSTLVFSGLFNVVSGVVFGIPLPVQPMKAIAAAAIASQTPLQQTVAAGALVSAAVLLLAATGLLRRLVRWVPEPVVRGIQLGAGLSLVLATGSGSLLGRLHWLVPSLLDNRLWALAAFAGLLLTQRTPAATGGGGGRGGNGRGALVFPYALVLFLAGLVLALAAALAQGHDQDRHSLPRLALWHPHLVLPDWAASRPWAMAVAQLPLTTLNSVVAVSALSADLFGGEYERVEEEEDDDDDDGEHAPLHLTSVTAFGISVGVMNLLGCWFGAMPVCHGAGGLAAQFRFGARSGASVVLLGLAKIGLGLFFGETLVDLLRSFPLSILGVLVLAAGLELALAGVLGGGGGRNSYGCAEGTSMADRPCRAPLRTEADLASADRERWMVLLMTTAGIVAFKNDAVGFLAGLLCHSAYRFQDWVSARRAESVGANDQQPTIVTASSPLLA